MWPLAGWEVLQEAAGVESTRSLGRDRKMTDTVSSGGAHPPGLRASVLELCLFSALCLASPRVFCGRITLRWILLSYLAPECGLEAGAGRNSRRAACGPHLVSGAG